MERRNLPMLAALIGSLVVHVMIARETSRLTVSQLGWKTAPAAPDEQMVTVALADHPDDPAKPPKAEADKPAADSSDAEPEAHQPKKDPPKKEPERPKIDRLPDDIGEATGTGIGTHRSEGDKPMQAREADNDQAFLSRDPRGPGRVGFDPSPSLIIPGEGGTGGAPVSLPKTDTAALSPPAAPQPQPRPSAAALAPRLGPSQAPDAAEAPPGLRLPLPSMSKPPAPAAKSVDLGPIVLLPKPQPKPPESVKPPVQGKEPKPGDGTAGAKPEAAVASADDGALPRVSDRPTATPGRTDPVVKAPPVEVPRIAPPKAADAPDPATPPKPQLALLLVPLPASPATDAARPALAMPRLAAEPVPPAPPSPPTPPAVTTATDAVPVPPAPAAPAQPSPTTAPPGDGRRPGPNVPAADPAQQSDSETDPFSKIGSVEFRDGRLDVQFGRKVKVTRPRVPIVGQIDAMTLRQPRVVLKVTTDVTGKVTSVAIHKSSGSNEIDQPCLIAMYDWWFEPAKDKAGRPLADTFLFTISFR